MKAPASLAIVSGLEDLEKDVEVLIRENQQQRRSMAAAVERERELNIYRSGSAPPTVEGSWSATNSLFGDRQGVGEFNGYDNGTGMSDKEMRLHSAYLSYCRSNEHLNPRLRPPALSKEDWRTARLYHVGASTLPRIDDRRKEVAGVGFGDGRRGPMFSLPTLDAEEALAQRRLGSQRKLVRHAPAGWAEHVGGDMTTVDFNVGLGRRTKSFADAFQESVSASSHVLRPASPNDFVKVEDPVVLTDIPRAEFQDGLKIADYLEPEVTSTNLDRVPTVDSLASALGAYPVQSATADPPTLGRSLSPSLPFSEAREDFSSNDSAACIAADTAITTAFSDLSLTNNSVRGAPLQDFAKKAGNSFSIPNGQDNFLQQDVMTSGIDVTNTSYFLALSNNIRNSGRNNSKLTLDMQMDLSRDVSSSNIYPGVATDSVMSNGFGNPNKRGLTCIDFAENHAINSPLYERLPTSINHQNAGDAVGQYLNGAGIPVPLVEMILAQQLQRNHSFPDTSVGLAGNLIGSSPIDMSIYQKAYTKSSVARHKLQYELPFPGKSAALFNHEYYNSLPSSLGLPYPFPSSITSIHPSLDSISPSRQFDELSLQSLIMRTSARMPAGSWNSEYGNMEGGLARSLLEELKNNKSRNFKLLDIAGHVVEFSADQYGSRFIQQKLEVASIEEKNKIFPEIFPHARALMTDVFGNYVIQKFLEHGSETQKRQLSGQLIGHVLSLSLQMYGCRVIQKALEVVDVAQQIQIVLELDGSIMKCVRDQNGNHVIQKCIECVPQERIQFIISAFYGQVVPLSTHPYGCRVIQRVLEYCDDAKTQNIIMEEILQAVCALAENQYGNYVVQHVLQHGRHHERSAIIGKLAGQIVKMSQQKFASNVIEKCLIFASPEERQLMVNEMFGSTDENEPLQAMMKDQFGNYVVQKALETCDDKNRELILSRIRAHVNALKRYTYGKHIATRVEKVVAAGERRLGISSCAP